MSSKNCITEAERARVSHHIADLRARVREGVVREGVSYCYGWSRKEVKCCSLFCQRKTKIFFHRSWSRKMLPFCSKHMNKDEWNIFS